MEPHCHFLFLFNRLAAWATPVGGAGETAVIITKIIVIQVLRIPVVLVRGMQPFWRRFSSIQSYRDLPRVQAQVAAGLR